MNPEQYIRKHLEKNLVKGQSRARKLQREIITECLFKYKQGKYHDIDELLAEATRRVNEYGAIGRGTTAFKFSTAMNISITTARRHLRNLKRIKCNNSKIPFIYTVGKV